MADLNQDGIRVQVLIEEQTELGKFSDALYIPLAQFQSLSQDDLDAMKKARADAWVQTVKDMSAQITPDPTPEELQTVKNTLTEQLAAVESQLADVSDVSEEVDSVQAEQII